MKYEKPEIVQLAAAITAVQKVDKDGPNHDTGICTPNAYEADE
jgi:hypothetical protein